MQSFDDVRYALRQLRRSPGFAFTSVLTVTMAIAANVVVFGVLNALVLHPLPVAEADRVVQVQRARGTSMSYLDYRDIRDRNRTFSNLAVYRLARIGFDISGNAQPADPCEWQPTHWCPTPPDIHPPATF
jgi:hypothetical protein